MSAPGTTSASAVSTASLATTTTAITVLVIPLSLTAIAAIGRISPATAIARQVGGIIPVTSPKISSITKSRIATTS
jgi:hypothetical protein